MRTCCMITIGLIVSGFVSSGRADILHLTNGGSIEGRIVEQDGERYKVRTLVGTVTVSVDAVDRIEKKPTVLDVYEERRGKVADTPAGQFEFATWCDENGLRSAWRAHLKRAIELDANYEPARRALGYVRVGGIWVDGRKPAEAAPTAEDQARAAIDAEPDEEKLIAAIQGQWMIRVRSIKTTKLHTSSPRLIREGGNAIAAIDDPLAILPLVRVLADGNVACRKALVQALSRFPEDEATMNLAALAITDRNDDVCRQALLELKRRNDPRVVPQFRRALTSKNDPLIRRAAIALGILESEVAVPELIDTLTARRRKRVEVSTRTYFRDYPTIFSGSTRITLGSTSTLEHRPMIGLSSIDMHLTHVNREFQVRDVTVYRTEVLEALKTITKQNFGFDKNVWRRWLEEQRS